MRTETEYNLRRVQAHQPLIRDYPAVLLRGKWIILGVTFLSLVAAFVFTKLRQPTYQASTAVMIQTRIAESGGLFIPAVGSAIVTNIRQNELEILRSQSLAESVARRLIRQMYIDSSARQMIDIILPAEDDKGKRTVASVEQVVKRLSTAVDFVTVRESDVIKIIAKSKDAREAALLANTFTAEYYNRNVYKSREKSRTLREFLQTQVNEQRTNLDRLEGALQSYMEKKGIVSLDEESRRMIEQLSQLEANRDATDISLKTIERTLSFYRMELPQQERMLANSIVGASDPYIQNLQGQLASLEVQRDVAISKNPLLAGKEVFSDKLREVDQQIQSLQEKLRLRTKDYIETLVPSPANVQDQASINPSAYLRQVKQRILETQVEIQALTAKKEALNRVVAEYEEQFEKIPGRNIQYARLERGRQGTEKLFIVLNDKLNEANISEQSQFGHIDIIDQAAVPTDPSSPNLLLNLALGFALGFFMSIVIVVGREYRDVRIHTPEDLKLKGHFPAAVVTNMNSEIRRFDGNRVLSTYGRPVDPHLLTLADSFSPVAESYRKLRTTVQFDRADKRPQSILVSSANSGEGKSTTASNLAVAYAQSGLMTLLVDCNLRRPRQHGIFDVYQTPGLTELLTGRAGYDNVVQMTAQDHLHILCSGSAIAHPAELLSSDQMKDLLEQAKVEYDVIVLDSPPILSVADASILSTCVDCTIMVVAAGVTRMEELERSIEMFGAVSSSLPKFVLNMFDQQRAYGISYKRSGYSYYGDAKRKKRRSERTSTEQKTT
ncbi:MAG: polysaccharide biosynthesis tyrosine autokinase [Ignavibacteriae bacterium]|nr:polysaccharide biosynthesis tyrosine autokinase [Ignavibacteriota bacterium]